MDLDVLRETRIASHNNGSSLGSNMCSQLALPKPDAGQGVEGAHGDQRLTQPHENGSRPSCANGPPNDLNPTGSSAVCWPIPLAPVMIGVDSFVAGVGAAVTEREPIWSGGLRWASESGASSSQRGPS